MARRWMSIRVMFTRRGMDHRTSRLVLGLGLDSLAGSAGAGRRGDSTGIDVLSSSIVARTFSAGPMPFVVPGFRYGYGGNRYRSFGGARTYRGFGGGGFRSGRGFYR